MAVTFVCPKGDQSEDPDYCSVCGTRIEGAMGAATMGTSDRCPSCGIQRIPGARFCETCRYDFKAQPATGFAVPSAMTATPAPEAASTLTPGPGPPLPRPPPWRHAIGRQLSA